MTIPEFSQERRTALLNAAREIAEKARLENRGLTGDEQSQIDGALAEAREIREKHAADAKHRQLMSELDSMAAASQNFQHDGVTPLLGLPGDGQRLSFGKAMASAAAHKIIPPGTYGAKAVATGGAIVVPQEFVSDPVKLGQPPTSLLSVLPVQVHASPQFAYLRQSVRQNAATVVPEGSVKPQSTYTVVKVTDQLDVLAHLSEPLPRMWVADAPAIQSFISNELSYGLALAVEAMALADIAGTSGIQSNSYSTSVLATLRRSVTLLESNGYPPAGFVMHPSDVELLDLALLSTSAIEFQGLPFDATRRTLWGLPITTTNAQSAGVAHTLASGAVGLNTDSQGVQIAWSETSNADDWSKNLIRARCEGRYATSVFQPLGVVQSDLTA